ncbi:guanine permease [Candidatus Magnetomorum sp. HK-1]|nr:guanine permease [Candidatus Magnetomorum sp. HK-1]
MLSLDKIFKLADHQTNVKTEILAGLTTFLATMYIIIVNPSIIQKTGMPFNGILTATVMVSALSSLAMGIYANNPIVIAPGMGLNAFFTFSVVLGMNTPWPVALGAVFWSGIVFLLLSVFNIRTLIVSAIPKQLRFAISGGIGLFITFIGFANAGFVVANPATIIGSGPLNAITVTFLAGLAVTGILVVFRIRGALIMGIILTTIAAIPIGRWWGNASAVNFGLQTLVTWQGLFSMPDFSLIFSLDLIGSLKLAIVPVIFSFLFTDMFDSLSTLVGVAEAGNIKDKTGEPRNIKESLIVDSLSTAISGILGSSSGTCYIESATGIEQGGRTGLTAVTAGLLFIPFMFMSPLLSMIPSIATSPALVLVGVFMMRPISGITWDELDNAIPAFLALILIPLTYSITQGIIWGFLSWTIIKLVIGKKHDVSPTLLVIDFFAILALIN